MEKSYRAAAQVEMQKQTEAEYQKIKDLESVKQKLQKNLCKSSFKQQYRHPIIFNDEKLMNLVSQNKESRTGLRKCKSSEKIGGNRHLMKFADDLR